MTTYNFKRESKVFVVYAGKTYSIDVYPDLTFSQTFNETSVPVKTLHSQYNMFEAAVINKANPANFAFTVPILLESDMNVLLDLLVNYDSSSTEATLKTCDLYVQSSSELYKLEKAVFENGTFTINKQSFISVSLSGTASKLTKVTGPIPGVLQARSKTRTFSLVTAMAVTFNKSPKPYITSVSVDLKNDVHWNDFATLQGSTGIIDASGSLYPGAFVVSGRSLSGTIQQYVTDETNVVNTWSTSTSLSIQAGNTNANWNIEFNMPSVVYTNRLDPQELFIKSLDFRMNVTPDSMSNIIKKRSS